MDEVSSQNYQDDTSAQVSTSSNDEAVEDSSCKNTTESIDNKPSLTNFDYTLWSEIALLLNVNTEGTTSTVNKGIETDLLTRLDELHGMLDMIKSDSFVLVNEFIPTMHSKMKELRPIFNQIDLLENFTETVKNDITAVERDLNSADSYSSLQVLKKVFSGMSLFGSKKVASKSYEPPTLFKTSDFIEIKK